MIKLKQVLKYFVIAAVITIAVIVFVRNFMTFSQRDAMKRNIADITGQNMRITLFDMNGKIIRRWFGVKKINDGDGFIFFYTSDGKYVQLPDSVWYSAEEE